MDFSHKHYIRTPCVGICSLDRSGKYCEGCGRNIEEIEDWFFLTDKEKLEILKQLPFRKKKYLH